VLKTIRRKLRAARTLSATERWTLCQAWALLLAVDVGLRTLPFPQVQRAIAGVQPSMSGESGQTQATIQRLQRLVSVAARNHLYPMTCLRRSLALQWLLRRRGIVTQLRLGVQKEERDLNAHAWLEYAGHPIAESPEALARFASLGTPHASGEQSP
jgi:hypothetical protein